MNDLKEKYNLAIEKVDQSLIVDINKILLHNIINLLIHLKKNNLKFLFQTNNKI